jgi:hypothetical protein
VGISAIIILLLGALAIAFRIQTFGTREPNFRWLGTGLLAALGGYVASEFLGPVSAWGWQWDGMAVVPALIAVVLVGILAEAAVRKVLTA